MNYREFRDFMIDCGLSSEAFSKSYNDLDDKTKLFFENMPDQYSGLTLYFMTSTLKQLSEYKNTGLFDRCDIEDVFYVLAYNKMKQLPDTGAKNYINKYFDNFERITTEREDDKSSKIAEAKEIFEYFYDFYIRNDDKNQETADRIKNLSTGNEEFFKLLGFIESHKITIPYYYNVYRTPNENLEYLSEFHETLKITIKFFHAVCKDIKFLGPFLGCTDSLSKARNSKYIFKKWDRLLFVYDLLVGHKSPTKDQLFAVGKKVIDKFKKFKNYDNEDLQDQVNKDYLEAQMMIRRATALTFPY